MTYREKWKEITGKDVDIKTKCPFVQFEGATELCGTDCDFPYQDELYSGADCDVCWDLPYQDEPYIGEDPPKAFAEYDQQAKADSGKPRLSLVPTRILWDIAQIREYGTEKYGDPDNWKKVEIARYWDAFLRHAVSVPRDELGKRDEESGFPHLWHCACNLAFLLELMEGEV